MVRSSWREQAEQARPARPAKPSPASRSGPREVYVARQPVFDRRGQAVAYELLYRSGRTDEYDASNGTAATAQVIVNAFMTIGLDRITGGRRAVIRFTRELLLSQCASVLPREQVIIDILKDVEPTPPVLGACQRLHAEGFKIAVDERALTDDAMGGFLLVADMVRVDFAAGHEATLRKLATQLRPPGLSLLASKVETAEELKLATKWGYDYFQGYHLSRPTMIRGEDVPGVRACYQRLVEAVGREALDFRLLASLVKPELSLTYKLLRYTHAARVAGQARLETVSEAMTALGEREFRKWLSLVCLSSMGEEQPRELLLQSAVRAFHCEAVARELGLRDQRQRYYMVGLLSNLESIVGQPMPLLLERLSLQEDIVGALVSGQGRLAQTLFTAIALEAGDERGLELLCQAIGLHPKIVSECYRAASRKAEQALAVPEPAAR